jgi:hypothetical protein
MLYCQHGLGATASGVKFAVCKVRLSEFRAKSAFFFGLKNETFQPHGTAVSANETGLSRAWMEYRLSRFLFEK